jgi:simple sugar transport system ATP-binding protein
MRAIAKSFGSVPALRGADFTLPTGEIHALLGENGAGKSTLMQVLFGLAVADAGSIEVHGRPLAPGSPRAAMAAGIGMVHQHFSQVPRMSVADNVWLGRPGLRGGRSAAREAVRRVGTATGLSLDPDAMAGELPIGLRQRLEIVKALAQGVTVLILDEPTASLTPPEVTDLFAALRGMAGSGLAIVLITHKLREAAQVADRVTVLRQGRVAATGSVADFDAAALATAMLGEGPSPSLAASIEPVPSPASPLHRAEPVLAVRDLVVRGAHGVRAVSGVSLDVHAHQIVGIAAAQGNGQRELMRAVAGIETFAGAVTLRGGAVGFVPEDRQHEGLILDFSIAENLALTEAEGFWLKRRYLESRAAVAIDEFGIRTGDATSPVRELSGGNQQKVAVARLLYHDVDVLLLDEPTRGIDVRSRAEIHRLIDELCAAGKAVLMISSHLDELIAVCDRIAVMHKGVLGPARPARATTERDLLQAAAGA